MVMKHNRILFLAISAIFLLMGSLKAQTTTTSPVGVDVLKAREALLKETTNLNKLKIKLANLNAEVPELEDKLNKANDRSTKSAVESKELSAKMSANAGDEKAAKKASRAAKTAYNDAKKAQKLTEQLRSNKQKSSSLEAAIEKSKAKIAKMDEQLKFTDNLNN